MKPIKLQGRSSEREINRLAHQPIFRRRQERFSLTLWHLHRSYSKLLLEIVDRWRLLTRHISFWVGQEQSSSERFFGHLHRWTQSSTSWSCLRPGGSRSLIALFMHQSLPGTDEDHSFLDITNHHFNNDQQRSIDQAKAGVPFVWTGKIHRIEKGRRLEIRSRARRWHLPFDWLSLCIRIVSGRSVLTIITDDVIFSTGENDDVELRGASSVYTWSVWRIKVVT